MRLVDGDRERLARLRRNAADEREQLSWSAAADRLVDSYSHCLN
jgi:hypothetical protein